MSRVEGRWKASVALLRRVAGHRWFGPGIASALYIAGLVVRFVYILKLHNPKDFVYSDMNMYVELGKRFARPGYVLKPYDVTHPPGLSELLAYCYRSDPSLQNLVRLQLLVSALVPLAVMLLAWVAFDRKAGLWALVVASFYLPFIDYAGFFLAEIYITLFATLSMAAYLAAARLIHRDPATPGSGKNGKLRLADLPAPRLYGAIALAGLSGFIFSLALVMKMVAAPALLCFFGLHALFTKVSVFRHKLVLVAAVMVATVPLSYWQADRCTRGNDGQFCPGSNKAAADFLMGHIGRVQLVKWIERDPRRPERIVSQTGFGSPAAYQHGYTKTVEFDFKITDTKRNKAAAWDWIQRNPGQAVVLSFEHVWDSFGGSLPWPAVATKFWAVSQLTHYLFLIFMILPATVMLLEVARSRGLVGLLRSMGLAIFAPIVGVIVSVMMATGEARYRIPWDMCFILLAIQFYRTWRVPLREPATVSVAETAAAPPEPAASSQAAPDAEPAVAAASEPAPASERAGAGP